MTRVELLFGSRSFRLLSSSNRTLEACVYFSSKSGIDRGDSATENSEKGKKSTASTPGQLKSILDGISSPLASSSNQNASNDFGAVKKKHPLLYSAHAETSMAAQPSRKKSLSSQNANIDNTGKEQKNNLNRNSMVSRNAQNVVSSGFSSSSQGELPNTFNSPNNLAAQIASHPDSLDLPEPRTQKLHTPSVMNNINRAIQRQDFIVAEELFDLPALSNRIQPYLNKQLMSKLRKFQLPVLSRQIESSLSHEFGIYIMATPWKLFQRSQPSFSEAARLVQERALYEQAIKSRIIQFTFEKRDSNKSELLPLEPAHRKLPFYPLYSVMSAKERFVSRSDITQECDVLYEEIRTGDYSRHMNHDILMKNAGLDPTFSNSKEKSIDSWIPKVFKDATIALSKNPSLHPNVKSHVLQTLNHFLCRNI
jgi:hypothetical protein